MLQRAPGFLIARVSKSKVANYENGVNANSKSGCENPAAKGHVFHRQRYEFHSKNKVTFTSLSKGDSQGQNNALFFLFFILFLLLVGWEAR